ncbi:MAG: CHRD domain-containing protein [Planctomycetota bacterium]
MSKAFGVLLAVVVVVSGASAHALLYHAEFPLAGTQEVPPNASAATGLGTVDYDDATNTLSWSITHSALSSSPTAAHFHGPAPAGVNAGIQLTLDHTANPIAGLAVITNTQEADLLNELWYANIHTAPWPGGEIRGQVVGFTLVGGDAPVPEPTGLGLLGLGLFALRRRRR